MSKQKPALAKGTRDFAPKVMAKRNFILNNIKQTFEKFGFQPLETPSIERFSVLTGKYGEEGDRLIFRVFNAGSLRNYTDEDYKEKGQEVIEKIAENALRYDLTVPFARFVVMNRGVLSFPFKRYQMQSVWRGDSPQKGRYREFQQCDADVVGTTSLICEAEIILMINEVFAQLKINDYALKINNRKILAGIAEAVGAENKESDFCIAIDKLDKIGLEKVLAELASRGFSEDAIEKIRPLISTQRGIQENIDFLKELLKDSETGKKGIAELEEVFSLALSMQPNKTLEDLNIDFDITLARGLSYYTGAIYEVKVNHVQIGSVSGGGRYDNLTETFGVKDMSGVGFSFGIDRIYDVMEELNLFPEETLSSTQVLISNFDIEAQKFALPILSALREAGIKTEIYPESVKLKKQMKYADAKNIPFVILIGEQEMQENLLTIKNMQSGDQQKLSVEEIIKLF